MYIILCNINRYVNGNRRYGGRQDPMHAPPPRGTNYGSLLAPTGLLTSPNGTQSSGGCVMMVYGLDKDKINADKLFNIFCLYGNVLKVCFSPTYSFTLSWLYMFCKHDDRGLMCHSISNHPGHE